MLFMGVGGGRWYGVPVEQVRASCGRESDSVTEVLLGWLGSWVWSPVDVRLLRAELRQRTAEIGAGW